MALRTAKTLWSFGCSKCNRVNCNSYLLEKKRKQADQWRNYMFLEEQILVLSVNLERREA